MHMERSRPRTAIVFANECINIIELTLHWNGLMISGRGLLLEM